MSRTPSSRMPVPASRIATAPSGSCSSTQEVLPPYFTVDGPGDAIDPGSPRRVRARQTVRAWPLESAAQKDTITPTKSSGPENNGSAENSTSTRSPPGEVTMFTP